MSGHISPKSTYITIFGALMVCTILTVIAAFINLGDLNFPVAITIAVFKATLVVLFFMHVKYGSKLTKLIVGVAFFFLGIMLSLTMADYLSRGWYTSARGSTSAGSIVNVTGPLTTGAQALEPAAQNTSPK
ncbi:MAG TPA: cytochrome C oxidase subunit IV family protein [Vicinamibacterales bacterium]|nr:cytochrome C oxidase subunit IV family protein [Vicinamibacterales bacterium]